VHLPPLGGFEGKAIARAQDALGAHLAAWRGYLIGRARWGAHCQCETWIGPPVNFTLKKGIFFFNFAVISKICRRASTGMSCSRSSGRARVQVGAPCTEAANCSRGTARVALLAVSKPHRSHAPHAHPMGVGAEAPRSASRRVRLTHCCALRNGWWSRWRTHVASARGHSGVLFGVHGSLLLVQGPARDFGVRGGASQAPPHAARLSRRSLPALEPPCSCAPAPPVPCRLFGTLTPFGDWFVGRRRSIWGRPQPVAIAGWSTDAQGRNLFV
jgi:hypothetical protein